MDLHESVQQILSRDTIVADLFYTRFLDEYPEVQQFFERIDLKDQAIVLMMAMLMMDQHQQHRYAAIQQYLKLLGRRHQLMQIPAELYPSFRQCLLGTLEKFHGGDWNGQLAAAWQTAIDESMAAMLAGYDDGWIG